MKVQAKSVARLGSCDYHVIGAYSLPKYRVFALRVLPVSLHQLVLLFGVSEEEIAGSLVGFAGAIDTCRYIIDGSIPNRGRYQNRNESPI